MATLYLYAQFTASKLGVSTLADVTIDVDKVNKSNGAVTTVVTGATVTSVGSLSPLRNGLYRYAIANVDVQTYDYLGTFKTADSTVDLKHVPSLRQEYVDSLSVSGGAVLVQTTQANTFAKETTLSTGITTITGAITNIPQPDLSGVAQQTTLQAVQAELESHANPAGQGARTVTVTVTDADAAPIEGARVRLRKGVETYATTTNASGVAELFVGDGTWTYVVTCTGYSSASGSVVVNGDEAVAAQLTAYVIPPASDPDLVSVVARPIDFELTPDATFHLTMDEPNPVILSGRFQLRAAQSDVAENGEAVLEVFPSSALEDAGYVGTYTLTCNQDRRLKKKIWVPDAGGDAATLTATEA